MSPTAANQRPHLSADELSTAQRYFTGSSQRLDLQDWLGCAPHETHVFMQKLGQALAWPYLPLEAYRTNTADLNIIPFAEAKRRRLMLVTDPVEGQILLCANPFMHMDLVWAERRAGKAHPRYLVHPEDLAAFLALLEDQLQATAPGGIIDDMGLEIASDEGLTLSSIAEDTSPVIRLVNATIYDACRMGVSDIHLEACAQGLRIRYRLDGVLSEIGQHSGLEQAEQVISRIKVMAELDIAEKRIPQDGRFKLHVRGHPVDFRVSIMPSIFGEDAVLRLLDKQGLTRQMEQLSLSKLGFDADTEARVLRLAREPYGMLLVTGPTGSGKTTSLYAVVESLDSHQDKIVTIEDPVEYQLPNALQIPVNEKKGLTFARGLRSILRHDPDTILVGEIRDAETAQIAIQSALTGHQVLTSVHANNAFDVLGRLLHMGVDPYNFVSALNGIVAQRLVRMNCPHCAAPYTPDTSLLHASGLDSTDFSGFSFMKGQGCAECRGTGYKGRQAVTELLVLNDDLRERILKRDPISRIKEAARQCGMHTLRENALHKVSRGLTTLEEINRVTFVDTPAH